MFLPLWTEEVAVVCSSEGVPHGDQPLMAKLLQVFRGAGLVARQRPREASTSRVDIGNVKLDRWTLEDGTMEKVLLLVRGGVQMAEDIRGPGRFTKEGNV